MNLSLSDRAYSRVSINHFTRLSCATLMLFSALAQNTSADGMGTEADPYLLSTVGSIANPLDSGYYEVSANNLTFNGDHNFLSLGKSTSGNVLTVESEGSGFYSYPGISA